MFPRLLIVVLPPFLVAPGAMRLLRHAGGKRFGSSLGEAGLPLGFLAGFVTTAGGLPFVDATALHGVGEAAVLALGFCLVIAFWSGRTGVLRPGLLRAAAFCGGLLVVAWALRLFALGRLPAEDWVAAFIALPVAGWLLSRLVIVGADSAGVTWVLAVGALGLAAIAWVARAVLLAELGLVLVAACVGLLCWSWFAGRRPAGGAVVAGGMIFIALALGLVRGALHPPWALIPLALVFRADVTARRMPGLSKLARRKRPHPLIVAAGAAIPALGAAGLAFLLARVP